MEDNQTAINLVNFLYKQFSSHLASGYPEEMLESIYEEYQTTLKVLGLNND